MPRVSLNAWLAVVASQQGPANERDRHVCHVLALRMRGDGREGCFPSQHDVGKMIGVSHKTAGKSLERLFAAGWIDRRERVTQYGRRGWIYFPSLPNGLGNHVSPMDPANGEPRGSQSGSQNENARAIGESVEPIGESASQIGEPRTPLKSLTETSLNCAASSSLGTSSAAQPADERRRLQLRARTLRTVHPLSRVAERMRLSEAEVRLLLEEEAGAH